MGRVLLGVSGGIAAYKACEVTRLLVKAGHDVVPLVTPGAQQFVTERTFLALARRPAAEDLYPHLTHADLLVVAPCTANTLAKLAHGIADNLLTEAALAHRGPVLVAPAMNPRMWASAATRTNVETLLQRGVELIGPDEGEMAEGEWGVGQARRAGRDRRPGAAAARAGPVDRPARPGHRRRDARTDRQRSVRRQSLLGTHGRRARRGGAPPWRRGDPPRREPRRPDTARGRDDSDADGRVDVRRRARSSRRRHPPAGRGGRRLRAGGAARGEASEGLRELDGRARAHTGHRARARRAEAHGTGARRVRRRARRGRPGAQAGDARDRRTPISSSSTTSAGPASASTAARTRSC